MWAPFGEKLCKNKRILGPVGGGADARNFLYVDPPVHIILAEYFCGVLVFAISDPESFYKFSLYGEA